MKKEYRVIEGYGQYFNRRWEVQEKYFYYENGRKIESWHMVFHSGDKNKCVRVMEKYSAEKIIVKTSFDAYLWN